MPILRQVKVQYLAFAKSLHLPLRSLLLTHFAKMGHPQYAVSLRLVVNHSSTISLSSGNEVSINGRIFFRILLVGNHSRNSVTGASRRNRVVRRRRQLLDPLLHNTLRSTGRSLPLNHVGLGITTLRANLHVNTCLRTILRGNNGLFTQLSRNFNLN